MKCTCSYYHTESNFKNMLFLDEVVEKWVKQTDENFKLIYTMY